MTSLTRTRNFTQRLACMEARGGEEDTGRKPCEGGCTDWSAGIGHGTPRIAGPHQMSGQGRGFSPAASKSIVDLLTP